MPRLSWLAFAGNPCSSADEAALPSAAAGTSPGTACSMRQQAGRRRVGRDSPGAAGQRRRRRRRGRQAVQGRRHQRRPARQRTGRLHRRRRASEPDPGAGGGQRPSGRRARLRDAPDRSGVSQPGRAAQPGELHARCVWGRCAAFTGVVVAAVRGVAAAAAHLHARGIMHGDLYGHNILCTGDGAALLGDFGAASVFDGGGMEALALQRLEVRAFGVLLGELLERCDGDERELAVLAALQRECVAGVPGGRPLFGEIGGRLGVVGSAIGDGG